MLGKGKDHYKYRHGMAKTTLYRRWVNMRQRCYLVSSHEYKQYGGRGIRVCDEWNNDFVPFMEWALANGYEKGLTLDRIDVNGNYEPSNCRWITLREQQNNKTDNVLLTFNGITHNMREWSEITGISYPTLQGRKKRGWSDEDSLTIPVGSTRKYSKHISRKE